MCWVTVEDVVRFFLGSVALFSQIALRSVSDLGAVRPARSALAVAPGDDALSAIMPLLRTALATHASVALVSCRCLVGEISPSTLCSLDASVAALSTGFLVSFVHTSRTPHSAALRLRNLLHPMSPSSSSPSSSSASCSSSEDEDEERNGTPACRSQGGEHGSSYSARWTKGREPIACRRRSSLVAVMAQAVAHRVMQVWVLDDEPKEEELVGVVSFLDVLRVLRRHLLRAHSMAD
ncbi:CBS domain-containing protein CBSX5-like [Hordeum vulgare subsp. vulgare]|uniref:CBS domain-containing protein n=1 Tax=Hordeum vulgare subsp. vulgare TaxID=112509 RepID=A0A8I6WUQ6_HORVV|nr:CBS domain-containing protein CBSX5-like [Hordeum vulgare subsp. vulgare]